MSNAIVFESETGNTKSLAEVIKAQIPPENCVYFGSAKYVESEIESAELIFVGFWTNKGSCDSQTEAFLKQLKNKKILLFGTAGFGGSPQYYEGILQKVKGHISSDNSIVGEYMCQGKMLNSVKNRYEATLEKDPENQQYKSLLENFEKASTHPDDFDKESLKKYVQIFLEVKTC